MQELFYPQYHQFWHRCIRYLMQHYHRHRHLRLFVAGVALCLVMLANPGRVEDRERLVDQIAGPWKVEVDHLAGGREVLLAVGGHTDLLEREVGVPHVGEPPKRDLWVGIQNFVLLANRHKFDESCNAGCHFLIGFLFFRFFFWVFFFGFGFVKCTTENKNSRDERTNYIEIETQIFFFSN